MCAKTHVHLAQQRLPSEISHRISFKLDVNSFLPLPSLYSNILETWLLVWNINKVKSLHHFYFLCFVLSCCYLNKGVFFSECFLKTHFLPAEYELTLTCWPAIALLFVCLTSSSLLVFDYMMSLGAGGKTCHCSGSGNNQRRKCLSSPGNWLTREVLEPASGYEASTQLVEGIWPTTASHLHCEGWPWRLGAAAAGHVGSLFSPVVDEACYFS